MYGNDNVFRHPDGEKAAPPDTKLPPSSEMEIDVNETVGQDPTDIPHVELEEKGHAEPPRDRRDSGEGFPAVTAGSIASSVSNPMLEVDEAVRLHNIPLAS